MLHYFKVTREMRKRRGEWQRRPPCADNFLNSKVDVSSFFVRHHATEAAGRGGRRLPPGNLSPLPPWPEQHPTPAIRQEKPDANPRPCRRGASALPPSAPAPPFTTVAGDNGLGRAAGDAPCPPAVGKCEAQSRPVPLLLREITARDSNGSDYVAAPHLPTVIRRVAKAAAPVHPQARRRELNRLRHREK